MTWTDQLNVIQVRLLEFSSPTPAAQNDVPFFTRVDIEKYLYEESNAMLRELRLDEIESLGEDAVAFLTAGATLVAHPTNTIGIIAAKVNDVPNVEVVPATYVASSTITNTLIYTVYGGFIHFTGANAEFMVLVAPTLTQWRGLAHLIMPPGRVEEVISRVMETLFIIDQLR